MAHSWLQSFGIAPTVDPFDRVDPSCDEVNAIAEAVVVDVKALKLSSRLRVGAQSEKLRPLVVKHADSCAVCAAFQRARVRLRKFLVGAFIFVLHFSEILESLSSWERLGVIAASSVALWIVLAWVWHVWQPNVAEDDRAERAVAGAIAGSMVVFAAQAAHLGIPGPDGDILLLAIIVGVISFQVAMRPPGRVPS